MKDKAAIWLLLVVLVGLTGCVTRPTDYTLNVTVSPAGSGTVSPSAGKYERGTQVSLNVTPAKGYIFSHWTGSGGDSFSGNPLIVVMISNVNLIAEFVPSEPPPWPNITAYNDSNFTINTSVGQEFVIALPYTSRLSADWAASYNGGMVALVDTRVTNDNPFPSGGLKWFLFRALKSGRTDITMSYGRQPQGPYAEQLLYSVEIK